MSGASSYTGAGRLAGVPCLGTHGGWGCQGPMSPWPLGLSGRTGRPWYLSKSTHWNCVWWGHLLLQPSSILSSTPQPPSPQPAEHRASCLFKANLRLGLSGLLARGKQPTQAQARGTQTLLRGGQQVRTPSPTELCPPQTPIGSDALEGEGASPVPQHSPSRGGRVATHIVLEEGPVLG